ncbi:hypothetical protein [Amycolatopsis jejuensis]|uniref:hypothetical protein n=1 Tax=Amycolatopsis jejuensis TaxID=330084 RepID=UPI0005262758|nr:hypothetical protein [Amycolatopsis jejuensis]
MANPLIREFGQLTPVAAQSASFTTSSAVKAQDLIVLFHALDFYAASELLTPTGTAGTWTLQATGDAGSSNPSIKLWTRPVTVDGVQTVTVNQTRSDGSVSTHYAHWFVLNGAGVTLAVDGTPSSVNGTSGATAQTIGAISPVGADDLWLAAIISGTFAAGDYTAPAGSTKVAEQDNGGVVTIASFRQFLTASGSTGTKTATFTQTEPWCSAAICIRSTASGNTRSLNRATETDSTAKMARGRSVLRAAEADSTTPLSRARGRVLGRVVDTSSTVGFARARGLTRVVETDTVSPAVRARGRTLPVVGETDTAVPFARGRGLGRVLEQDTTGGLVHAGARVLGRVVDTSAAIPFARGRTLSRVVEQDTASAPARGLVRLLGRVVDVESALPFARARALARVVETSVARALARGGTGVPVALEPTLAVRPNTATLAIRENSAQLTINHGGTS